MNSPLNSKLLFLPLRELQQYLSNLELENEKLKNELTTFSRFNCILENIRRSSNKGFNSMQLIDQNKSCRCNEHLNGHLRRCAQEADIELRVWQEQYDKLVLKTKQDYINAYDEDNRSVSLSSPRSSNGVSPPLQDIPFFESEPETTRMSLNSVNTSDTNCLDCDLRKSSASVDVISRTSSISSSTSDSYKSNQIFENRNAVKERQQTGINDEQVIQYITLSPSADESTTSRSPPLVVYDSKKDSKLVCDWPNCERTFVNEEILIHHRRNHIRKSIYHCELCSTRLLSKEELDNHLKKYHNRESEDSPKDHKQVVDVEEDEEVDITCIDVENISEAVNLSNKNNINSNDMSYDKNERTFHSECDRLTAHPFSSLQSVVANSSADNSKANDHQRPEEYKRTRYSGVGRYRCPWPDCGYTPHFLRDLRRHMYKHTGDKKHKCNYPGCDFVSVWKTSLLQHQRKKHFVVNNTNNINDSLFNAKSIH